MDTLLKSNFSRCVRYLYRCGPAYVFRKVAGPGSGGALITGIDDITGFSASTFCRLVGDAILKGRYNSRQRQVSKLCKTGGAIDDLVGF